MATPMRSHAISRKAGSKPARSRPASAWKSPGSGVRGLQTPGRSAEVRQWVLLLCRQIEGHTREIAAALIRRDGLGEQEALGEPASELAQLFQLLPTLDPLGDHLDVEMSCHGNDCAHDRKVTDVRHQVANKAAVDLDV